MRSRLLLLVGQTIALGLTIAFLVVPVSAVFLDEYGARCVARRVSGSLCSSASYFNRRMASFSVVTIIFLPASPSILLNRF